MKKTIIVMMMVLLSLVLLVVSCDDKFTTDQNGDNAGGAEVLPTDIKVGETVTLGTVTWLALDVDAENKQALLISKDILSSSIFDSDSNDYASSYIREYINGRNAESNFLEYYGLKTDYMVNVDVTSDIETTTKNTGSDYLFLLSWTEANNTEYFKDDAARVANNTWWWLRSPSDADGTKNACNVTAGGSIMNNTYSTKPSMPAKDMLGLRPAFWYKWN